MQVKNSKIKQFQDITETQFGERLELGPQDFEWCLVRYIQCNIQAC